MLVGATLAGTLCPRVAAAAELYWNGPSECQRADTVRSDVESLVGRSLGDVETPSFELTVKHDGERWTAELVTAAAPGGASSRRTLDGQSCVEVTDAAGVAMAMAIRAAAETPKAAEPAQSEPAADTPAASPQPRASSSELAREPSPLHPPNDGAHPRALVGLAASLDSATLPSPSPGVTVNAGAQYRALRVEAQGSMFLPSEALLASRNGAPSARATFDLLAVAAVGCVESPFAFASVHGCGGYEIGQLTGEGDGVTNPHVGSVLWQAVRLELGATSPSSSALRFAARLGIAVPLARRQFQLDGSNIHRPAAMTLRAAVGAEFRP